MDNVRKSLHMDEPCLQNCMELWNSEVFPNGIMPEETPFFIFINASVVWK